MVKNPSANAGNIVGPSLGREGFLEKMRAKLYIKEYLLYSLAGKESACNAGDLGSSPR